MALVVRNDFPGNGMTYQQLETVQSETTEQRQMDLQVRKYCKHTECVRTETVYVDRNLLFNIFEVTNRYSKDAFGLRVPLSEVFAISMYRFGTNKFFNQALELLQDEGFITRTAFTVTLTPAGFDYIHNI